MSSPASPVGRAAPSPTRTRRIRELVTRCQALPPTLIVLEATGGYEAAVVAALAAAGLPVVVANPRQVRDFAKATGQLAKTDALDAHDARALRRAGAARASAACRTTAIQALDALLTRRRQLVEMLTAERNRLLFARAGRAARSPAAHPLARAAAARGGR